MPGVGARGQNLEHLQNLVFVQYSFLEVRILTTTGQKAFILHILTTTYQKHSYLEHMYPVSLAFIP